MIVTILPGLQSSTDFANKLAAMKSYLFALLININVLRFVKSCNEFGDFCDAGDGEFPELESDHNSLTTIMDRRMRTRHGPIFFKIRQGGRERQFIFVGEMSFFGGSEM